MPTLGKDLRLRIWACALRMPMPGIAFRKSQPAMTHICTQDAGRLLCSSIPIASTSARVKALDVTVLLKHH